MLMSFIPFLFCSATFLTPLAPLAKEGTCSPLTLEMVLTCRALNLHIYILAFCQWSVVSCFCQTDDEPLTENPSLDYAD